MASPMVTGPVGIYVGLPTSAGLPAAATITTAGFTFPGGLGGLVGGVTSAVAGLASSLSRLTTPPQLLGTAMRGPRIKLRRSYSRVFNDLSGAELAFDKIWAGEEALIFFDLTRWNETVYMQCGARPARRGPTLGSEPALTRGTLMMTEGMNWPLYLRFPFFDAHPYFAANGGVAGYRLLSCSLEGEDDFETGSAANIRHLAVHAIDVFDPTSNGFALFDFNMAGVPPIVPN